jgi:hypothetical protein
MFIGSQPKSVLQFGYIILFNCFSSVAANIMEVHPTFSKDF